MMLKSHWLGPVALILSWLRFSARRQQLECRNIMSFPWREHPHVNDFLVCLIQFGKDWSTWQCWAHPSSKTNFLEELRWFFYVRFASFYEAMPGFRKSKIVWPKLRQSFIWLTYLKKHKLSLILRIHVKNIKPVTNSQFSHSHVWEMWTFVVISVLSCAAGLRLLRQPA